MRRIGLLLVVLATSFIVGKAQAEPTTNPVKILEIRPYMLQSAPAVYVYIDQVSLCNTNLYKIDLSVSGSKEMYAAALSALLADKPVKVEVAACTGWGTTMQSIYIVK